MAGCGTGCGIGRGSPAIYPPAVITVGVSSIYNRAVLRQGARVACSSPLSGAEQMRAADRSSRSDLHPLAVNYFAPWRGFEQYSSNILQRQATCCPESADISLSIPSISSKSLTIQIAQSRFFAHFCSHFRRSVKHDFSNFFPKTRM